MADLADVSIAASEESKTAGVVCNAEDAAFWAKEFAWGKALLEDPLEVTVGTPLTASSFAKTYTTYLISSSLTTNPPRRRFSCFVWLRNLLITRFPGMFIPPLPEKRVMNLGDEFINARMKGLNAFITEILRNPYLRHDSAVNEFLTQSNKSAWDKYKKVTKAEETPYGLADSGINEATKRWEAAMNHLPVPSDGHACCTSLKKYIEAAERDADATQAAAKKFAERSVAYAAALDEFKTSLETMRKGADAAQSVVSTSAGDVRDGARVLVDTLQKTGTALTAWHDLAGFQPNEIEMFITETFGTVSSRLRAIRELLAQREITFSAYQSAFTAHQRKQADHAKATASGNASKAAKIEVALKKAEAALASAEARMNNCVKGIVFYEIGRRDADHHDRIKNSLAQFAALCVASAERSRRLWGAYIGDLDIGDESELLDATQATLRGDGKPFVERDIAAFADERKLAVYGAGDGVKPPAPETTTGAGAGAGAGAPAAPAAPAAAAAPAPAAAAPAPAPAAAAEAEAAASGTDAAPAADATAGAPVAVAPPPVPAAAAPAAADDSNNPFGDDDDDEGEGNPFGGDESTIDL